MIYIFNIYDSSKTLGGSGGGGYKEHYYPLWIYSSGYIGSGTSTSSGLLVPKGSTSLVGNTSTSAVLHILNSSWSTTQKFSFECSCWISGTVATGYVALYDITTKTVVVNSQISTNATSMTLYRSNQFTLVPGHSYGVTMWASTTSPCILTKAQLVAIMD